MYMLCTYVMYLVYSIWYSSRLYGTVYGHVYGIDMFMVEISSRGEPHRRIGTLNSQIPDIHTFISVAGVDFE